MGESRGKIIQGADEYPIIQVEGREPEGFPGQILQHLVDAEGKFGGAKGKTVMYIRRTVDHVGPCEQTGRLCQEVLHPVEMSVF
jgi:hypothetical protein